MTPAQAERAAVARRVIRVEGLPLVDADGADALGAIDRTASLASTHICALYEAAWSERHKRMREAAAALYAADDMRAIVVYTRYARSVGISWIDLAAAGVASAPTGVR